MQTITWLTRLVLLLVVLPVLRHHASAQESTVMVGNEKTFISWEQFDKTLVEVEGLAWGTMHKGLGAHLVLAQENEKVYLTNIDLANTDLNGRLVGIVGRLYKQRMEKAPPGTQGYGQDFDYYSIDVIAVRRIEKVEQYQVLPARGEWIVVGMWASDALQKVKARQWPVVELAMTAPSNLSKRHSFQVDQQRVLIFNELKGEVVSVAELRLNDPRQRADDQLIPVRGFELPPLTAVKATGK